MKIDITEKQYFYMADDDKVRLFVLVGDTDLHTEIQRIRKKYSITDKNYFDIFDSRSSKNKKLLADIEKLVAKKTYLTSDWLMCLVKLLFENKISDAPLNYTFSQDHDSLKISIRQLKSKSNLIDWIDHNWDSWQFEVKPPHSIIRRRYHKKSGFPTYGNLVLFSEIFELKKKGLSFGKIANKINKDTSNDLEIEKDNYKKLYYRFNQAINKFFEENSNFDNLLNQFGLKK